MQFYDSIPILTVCVQDYFVLVIESSSIDVYACARAHAQRMLACVRMYVCTIVTHFYCLIVRILYYFQALKKQGLDTKPTITKEDLEEVISEVGYIYLSE